MLRLFRYISWRHIERHRLRTFLTFLGIALGVSVVVAIAIVNRTLSTSFQSTIDKVAGKAVLQVTNGESGVRESLFPVVRDTPGVQDAAAAVENVLPVAGFEGERLYTYGVDFLTDYTIREHRFAGTGLAFEQGLDFIAQPDSIALTESFANRLGLTKGSEITLITSQGRQRYTVRALLQEQGAARVFGGNFALLDLPVAQQAFGKEGKLDVIDVTVAAGETIETVRERLQRRVQGVANVERPRNRGEQIELLLTSFRVGLFFVSLIAMFVGFFLIYNTMSVSVMQRRREMGALRCIGMRRREILQMILLEAAVLAVLGALGGAALGYLLAQGALLAVGETVTNLFSQIDMGPGTFTWVELSLALASGVGVALFAALHPAWQATRVSPLENARQATWSPSFGAQTTTPTILGVLCLGASPVLILMANKVPGAVEQFSIGVMGMLVFLLAVSFLCPVVIVYSVGQGWRWLARCSGTARAEIRLMADGLRRSALRTGIAVATLVISLAAIFTIAAFVHSVRGSLLAWVDQMVTADLIVSSGARTAGPKNVPLREELLAGLRDIPGVAVVDLYRLIRSSYRGKPVLIESFSGQASSGVRTLPMVEGEGARVLRAMGAGTGVVISESFQSRFGNRAGGTIRLATPSGVIPFKILGVYVDYSSDSGSVLIDRALYKKYWRDNLVDAFDLWLDLGADEAAVIRHVKQAYGEKYQLFISTHKELRDAVVGIMEQSFVVNYAVEIVAVVVAILSIINTLLASIMDRTREIAVLRAIGATQAQIRRIIMMEAGWMGFLGGGLGLFAGSLMAYHHVVYNTKVLTGWTFQFYYPYDLALLSVFVSVFLCLVAGYGPAKQAAAKPIVAGIGYE